MGKIGLSTIIFYSMVWNCLGNPHLLGFEVGGGTDIIFSAYGLESGVSKP